MAPLSTVVETPAPLEGVKKAPKRFWYLVDDKGDRIEKDGKQPKIHGKNPFQAVQKAVTRYATDLGKEYEFHLREAKGKPTKAGKLRVYKYKGWKTALTDAEKSDFTNKVSITSKPHAKSLGVTLIDAPVKVKKVKKIVEAPKEVKVEPPKEAPKKRARKAKEATPAAPIVEVEEQKEAEAPKKRARKAKPVAA